MCSSDLRLRQLRNQRRHFIEYLVPALELTAVPRTVHGFVSDVGKLRPAASKIFKKGHVICTLNGLVFYAQLCRVNLVPSASEKNIEDTIFS